MHTRLGYYQFLSFILAGVSCIPAGATILTFDSTGLSSGDVITNYGSNVTGTCTSSGQPGCFGMGNGFTPNIAVSYRTISPTGVLVSPFMRFWDFNYGDLVNVTYMAFNSNVGEVTFTPQNGNGVRINSLDAGGWNQADRASQTIRILDSANNVLFSFSGTIHGAGPTHDHFNPNVSSFGPLRLQQSSDFNVGLDNVNFDQVAPVTGAPEPSTLLLAMAGMALVISRTRTWRRCQ